MGFRTDILELIGLNTVIVILCVIGIASDIWSRLLFNGIDGILLMAIALMMAGIFLLQIFLDLKTAGYIGTPAVAAAPSKPAPAAAASAPAATPAAVPAANPESK
jgi:hypothetical protein